MEPGSTARRQARDTPRVALIVSEAQPYQSPLSELVVEGLSVAVTVWRRHDGVAPSYQLLTLNDAAGRLLDLDRGDLGQLQLHEVFPERGPDIAGTLDEVLRDGARRHLGELRYGDDQAPDLVLMAEAFPLNDSSACVMLEDITERLWVETTFSQSEELWRCMLENAPGYIFATDLEGNILLANQAPQGLVPEHMVGSNVLQYAPAESRDLLAALLREAISSKARRSIETRGETSGRWYRLEVGPMIRGGVVFGLVTIQLDITDRKGMEIDLADKNRALAISNENLEEFAYAASHDLQEPLRMVSSYAELLVEEYGEKLSEEADGYISRVVDGAKRMQTLIHDLLRFSRVDTRGGAFEPTDLSKTVSTVLGDLQIAIREADAKITVGVLPTVPGDRTQLHQLFLNIIGNALKFRGEAAARVEVQACRTDDRWQISVRDQGIGLDMRFADRVFRVFQRLHRQTEIPGTGIGLALCKKIVERHGGTIWVESEEGAGTTFHFTLRGANDR